MELTGKSFKVRGTRGFETTIDVLGFEDQNLLVHMMSKTQWGMKESTEKLSIDLFDSCIRTGYIQESA